MAFIKNESLIGKKVILTEIKESCAGLFEIGTVCIITEECERGYTFEDEYGNKITEAGYGGFQFA